MGYYLVFLFDSTCGGIKRIHRASSDENSIISDRWIDIRYLCALGPEEAARLAIDSVNRPQSVIDVYTSLCKCGRTIHLDTGLAGPFLFARVSINGMNLAQMICDIDAIYSDNWRCLSATVPRICLFCVATFGKGVNL